MMHVYRRPADYAKNFRRLGQAIIPAAPVGQPFDFTANEARAIQFLACGHISHRLPHWDSADAFDSSDEFAVLAGVYPIALAAAEAGVKATPKIYTAPRPAGSSMIVS